MKNYLKTFLVRPGTDLGSKFNSSFFLTPKGLEPSYQLYLPKRFIIGNFTEQLQLNPNKIFYEDSPKILRKYHKAIKEGNLEVTKTKYIPKIILESLANEIYNYVNTEKRMNWQVKAVKKYLKIN